MIRNEKNQSNDHIPIIMIEDQNSFENTSPNFAKDSHPQYDFVSNSHPVPPRL
jgi:hypothetical protein